MTASHPTPHSEAPATVVQGTAIELVRLRRVPPQAGHDGDAREAATHAAIAHFKAHFNGREILSITWQPPIAAEALQPILARVPATGTFDLTWTGTDGVIHTVTQPVAVI